VVSGFIAVRENEISKETEIREVGAICLSCGQRQSTPTTPVRVRHLPPMEWSPPETTKASHLTTAFVEALDRADHH